MSALLANYADNDFRYVAGTANSQFPAGALLGWGPLAGPAFQAAMDADAVTSPQPTGLLVNTWSSGAINNRGRLNAGTIPATYSGHACVLAKDVDTYYNEDDSIDYIVPVIVRGTFKRTGIIQDVDSYNNASWPLLDGTTTRLALTPIR